MQTIAANNDTTDKKKNLSQDFYILQKSGV